MNKNKLKNTIVKNGGIVLRYRKITLLFMVLTFCVLFFCNDVHAASITSPTGSVRGTATFAVYASHAYMADFTVTDSAGNIKIGSAKIYGSNSLSSRPIDITAWKNGSYSIVCTVYCSYRDSDGEYHSWQENASGQFSIDKEFGAVIVSPEGSVKGQCTLGVQAVVDGAVPTKVDIVVKDSTGIKKIDYYINQHINGLFRYGPIDITSWKNGTYTFEAVMHFTSGEKTELITGEFSIDKVFDAVIVSPEGSVRGQCSLGVQAVVDGAVPTKVDIVVKDSTGIKKIDYYINQHINGLFRYGPIDITSWKNGTYTFEAVMHFTSGEKTELITGEFSIDKVFDAVIVSPEGSVRGQCSLGVQAVVDGAVPTKVDIVVKDSTGIKKIDYYINRHIKGLFQYGPIDITSWKNGTYTFEAVMHFTSGEKTELITGEFSIDKVFDAVIVSPEGSVRGQCSLGVQAVVDGAVPTKVDIVVKDSTGIKKIDYYINRHIKGLFQYGPIDITSWKNGTYTFEAVMHFTSGEKTEPITRKFTVDKVFGISVIFPSEDEKVGGLQELKAFVNLDGAVFSTIQFIIKDSSGAKIAELTPRPGYAGYYVTVVDFSNYSDGEYSITALLKITSGESDDDTHNFKVEKIYRARILRPSAGAKVHGTITVRSQITIEKARMRYLQLHIRKKGQPSTDKLLSEWRSETNNREYNYNLNTTAYENGDYELYLVLTNTTERDPPFISPPTEIKIDNRLDIEISQPSDGASILLPSTGIIVVKAVKAYGDYSITKMLFYIRPENGVYPINPSAQDITPDGAGIYEGQIPVSVPGTYFVKAVAEYRTSSLSSQVEHEHKFTVFEQGALAISCNPGWVRPAAFVVGYRKRLIDEAKTKVTVTGAKPGAQITLEIEGIYDTGGHLAELIVKNADGTVTVRKHETPRPTGTFESGINKISGVTDDNGTFSCIYTASSIAGQERIIAKCDGKRAEYVLDVKIPDLVKMPKPEGKRYELVGCPSGAHSETHYLLPGFIPVLDIIAQKYYGKFEDDRMKFNDMSLPWGGKFDYKYNNWTGPHDTHMSGRCCDLNDVGRGQGVPPFNDNARNEFLEDLIRNELKLYLLKEPTCWHIQWNYKVDGSRGGY